MKQGLDGSKKEKKKRLVEMSDSHILAEFYGLSV